jgi:hypothetical protein
MNETTTTELELASIPSTELPTLEIILRNAKHEIIANVGCQIAALITSPENRILYGEFISTSDAGAHAVMGAFSDPRGALELRFYRVGGGDYVELLPPESPRLANLRLAVQGWRQIQHVGIIDSSGELLLAPDDETLWRKLREKQSAPTVASWGEKLMPKIHVSGLLLECESFCLPEGMRAFVLAANAEEIFDSIVSKHVRTTGIPQRTAAA